MLRKKRTDSERRCANFEEATDQTELNYIKYCKRRREEVLQMLKNSKNAADSQDVSNVFYWHMFPSDCIDDCAFQRSAVGPVRRLTDLVSPSTGMTQPSILNLLSRGPLFIMSQRASHTLARLGESQKSSCSWGPPPQPPPPLPVIPLINGHVQSTYCVFH